MSYNLSFPPVVLPRDLGRQTESLRALMGRLGDAEGPELVVLLLRAAPVPFAAVEGCAEAQGVALPPVIGAHIGSEVYDRFDREAGPNLDLPFAMLGPGELGAFARWLDGDAYMQGVVAGMRADAAAAGVGRPRRVMVYDDFEGHGGTLFAARHLIGRAFAGAVVEHSISWFRLHELAGTPRLRLRMNERGLASVELFLCDLLTGYRETEEGLRRLDSAEELRLLGKQCVIGDEPDPYPLLAEVYGDEGLMGFSGRVREVLRAWGRTVAL